MLQDSKVRLIRDVIYHLGADALTLVQQPNAASSLWRHVPPTEIVAQPLASNQADNANGAELCLSTCVTAAAMSAAD